MKIKTFDLRRVLRIRQKLVNSLDLVQYIGPPLRGDEFPGFVRLIQRLLPGVEYATVEASLQHLANAQITSELLDKEAWRLAGNIEALAGGTPAPLWLRQTKDEWVPFQAVQMRWHRSRKGQVGGVYTCRALAGTPTGLLTTKFFSRRFSFWLAKQLGFGKVRMQNQQEIVGLQFYGHVVKEASVGRPVFTQVAVPGSVVRRNSRVLAKRRRIGFKCPRAFTHPCYLCPVGYDQCPVAVHPRTYVRGFCKVCEQTAWLDPLGIELETCVDCRRRLDSERKGK